MNTKDFCLQHHRIKKVYAKNWTIIIKGGKIISADYCCNLGKPTNYLCRKVHIVKEYGTRHSEIQALSRIKKTLDKERKIKSIKIINFRINKNGEIKNSKPCLACSKVLQRLDIINIIYSNDNGDFIKDKVNNVLQNAKYSTYSKSLVF